jgi:hypothetical protein
VYIHTYCEEYRDAGCAKEIKRIGTEVNAMCQGNLSACRRFASPDLVCPRTILFKPCVVLRLQQWCHVTIADVSVSVVGMEIVSYGV